MVAGSRKDIQQKTEDEGNNNERKINAFGEKSPEAGRCIAQKYNWLEIKGREKKIELFLRCT